MDRFLSFLEQKTIAFLTKRKAVAALQAANKAKRTFVSEAKGWLDALVFAVFAVLLINQYLFQLFVIPSPSMVPTLKVGDRVFVSKRIYGVELYPGGPKLGSENRQVARDQIITFYNPEYDSKGPLFDVLSQIIYSGTFSLVNIDRNPDGSMAERLYVKRAIGMPSELVRFVDGSVQIRRVGENTWVKEDELRSELGLVEGPHRTLSDDLYTGLRAWGSLYGYQEAGINLDLVPTYLKNEYAQVSAYNYPPDMYSFTQQSNRTQHLFDPSDMQARSAYSGYQRGIYIPEGHILPLGDNRDDSRDGRYFGPVSHGSINGSVRSRFWPPKRIAYLGNK
ncbi:MAG TPA: signal peptidase I [Sphaerochaeta sp.]|nr:signal peptidase I [Sphaerochaeta sp.]